MLTEVLQMCHTFFTEDMMNLKPIQPTTWRPNVSEPSILYPEQCDYYHIFKSDICYSYAYEFLSLIISKPMPYYKHKYKSFIIFYSKTTCKCE